MPTPLAIVISGAVEGSVDEAVLKRLITHVGAMPGPVYGKRGKPALLKQLSGYNQAAQHTHTPWMVLMDLDGDADCAPPFRDCCLPQPAPQMCFRIAVREVESWLFADRQRLARFLAVPVSSIPPEPEAVDSPKDAMTHLASQSRRSEIREDMVPRPGSGRRVGPAYTSRLIQFVLDQSQGWQPATAAGSSRSLASALACLHRLVRF